MEQGGAWGQREGESYGRDGSQEEQRFIKSKKWKSGNRGMYVWGYTEIGSQGKQGSRKSRVVRGSPGAEGVIEK